LLFCKTFIFQDFYQLFHYTIKGYCPFEATNTLIYFQIGI